MAIPEHLRVIKDLSVGAKFCFYAESAGPEPVEYTITETDVYCKGFVRGSRVGESDSFSASVLVDPRCTVLDKS